MKRISIIRLVRINLLVGRRDYDYAPWLQQPLHLSKKRLLIVDVLDHLEAHHQVKDGFAWDWDIRGRTANKFQVWALIFLVGPLHHLGAHIETYNFLGDRC